MVQNPSRIRFFELCAHLLSVTQEKFGYLWLPISPFAHLTVRHTDSLSHPSPSLASAKPSDTSSLRKGATPADSVIPMEYNSHRPWRKAEFEEHISSNTLLCSHPLSHRLKITKLSQSFQINVWDLRVSLFTVWTDSNTSVTCFFQFSSGGVCEVLFFSLCYSKLPVSQDFSSRLSQIFFLSVLFCSSPNTPPFFISTSPVCRQGLLEVINVMTAILGSITWITVIRRLFL